ncbi:FAD-dependent oxidoreductase [Kitasatospora sp. NPDC048407]|uniref:FAD-dependent oxidoreductase n=1 Tax=Kitasatospora sp. NPDC048407 TaxID=3364051 RepID=UPI003723D692
MTTAQVLVVGAGPVGLTAAHELARHGVTVRLVDAADGPATTSRALATHARTLEVYDQIGILDEVLPRGQRVEHFTLHQNGRRLARFDTDYSHLPTRFPFTLMVDQVITEEVLRTACARQGVQVEWGVRLASFDDRGDGVGAVLTHPDGRTEHASFDWMIGCDGGHSTVRKQLGIPLIGESSETWLIADAVVDCDLPRDSIHWMRTPAGTVMMVPFPDPGKWRLLDTADASYPSDEAVARRFAEKISIGTGRPVEVELPTWVSVFTIQQRMIEQMRSGRVFLAGDAAHVHSPASGQGLNTGIQDAVNLAWKLAAVVNGEAAETLLDSYSAERVPVGATLLKSTRMATMLVQLRSRKAAAALRTLFTVVRSVRPLKSKIERKIMGGMSALDLSYADGPLALPAAPATGSGPAPGQRVAKVTDPSPAWTALLDELRTPGWTLLARAVPAQYPALHRLAEEHPAVRVRTLGEDGPGPLADPDGALAADLGVPAGGWLLIRPDGHLAASGPGLDAAPPAEAFAALGLRAGAADRLAVG